MKFDFKKGSIHYSLKDDENIELGKGTAFIEYEPFPKISKEDFKEFSGSIEIPNVDFGEMIMLSLLKSWVADSKCRIKRWHL